MEQLTGEWRGLFKLRVGSHRVIYAVSKEERIVTVYLIGHGEDAVSRTVDLLLAIGSTALS